MGWVFNATPRPLYPRERPGTHCIGMLGGQLQFDYCHWTTATGQLQLDNYNLTTAVGQLQLGNCNCTTAIWQLQLGNCNLTTAIGQLQLDNCNLTTAIGQMQLHNCNLTTAIGQLQFDNCNWATAIWLLQLNNCNWTTAVWQLLLDSCNWTTATGQPQLDNCNWTTGQVRKISLPPGFDPRTFQPVASRYTDWATPTHPVWRVSFEFWDVTPCSFELVFLKTFISLVDAGNMEHTEQVQVFRRCLLSPSAVRQLLSPSTLIDCYLRTDHSSNLHVQRPSKWTWCQLCVCVCVCVCVRMFHIVTHSFACVIVIS